MPTSQVTKTQELFDERRFIGDLEDVQQAEDDTCSCVEIVVLHSPRITHVLDANKFQVKERLGGNIKTASYIMTRVGSTVAFVDAEPIRRKNGSIIPPGTITYLEDGFSTYHAEVDASRVFTNIHPFDNATIVTCSKSVISTTIVNPANGKIHLKYSETSYHSEAKKCILLSTMKLRHALIQNVNDIISLEYQLSERTPLEIRELHTNSRLLGRYFSFYYILRERKARTFEIVECDLDSHCEYRNRQIRFHGDQHFLDGYVCGHKIYLLIDEDIDGIVMEKALIFDRKTFKDATRSPSYKKCRLLVGPSV